MKYRESFLILSKKGNSQTENS